MDWIEVCVGTTGEGADAVSELLMSCGARGTQIIDRADVPEPGRTPGFGELFGPELAEGMPEKVQVKAWYASLEEARAAKAALGRLEREVGLDFGSLAYNSLAVADEDWAENWKKYYKPMRVGERLVIKPGWEEYARQPGDLVIQMDPGMAFGTGTHETTRLCLEMIEKHSEGGPALDLGTGSGILAIALALLGRQPVLAVDIDPVAVRAAEENVRRNGLEGHVQVVSGDLTKDVSGQFQFISANILADIVISLAEPLKALMAPGARFLASGIIRDREGDVLSVYREAGYRLQERREIGEWVALLLGLRDA